MFEWVIEEILLIPWLSSSLQPKNIGCKKDFAII